MLCRPKPNGLKRAGQCREQYNCKNLLWLGRPANIASKLTDLANKKVALVEAVCHGSNWIWHHGHVAAYFATTVLSKHQQRQLVDLAHQVNLQAHKSV
jgi:class 3 adenylate cyclase